MMNRLYKAFSTSRLRSHLLFIVDILLMKKEKDDILLFVSDSILKNSMMRT
ncbi:preprotein translocase subunit SecG [Prevotella bivia]|uniref:preprotein translocase subunit SecG n=1 Tax=Prevotella bivia TaxID=28125 RepID=UPI000ABE317F|nr:preprotein translocase subunit SecG [Prevotella bivia]MDU3909886.1 preprotein translocase subunit SecG [Prevotella bivia]